MDLILTARMTSNPTVNTPTGSGVAGFLLDQMDTSAFSNAPDINDAQWYRAGYVQDDWKVTDRLTLNLGLRYDYYQPSKENSGAQMNFIPTSLGLRSMQSYTPDARFFQLSAKYVF